jgi:hypothetical protein
MIWNSTSNKFDVSVAASYTDTNVRTVLSNSAGTNMTWNTGTNKFDVAAPYTDTNTRTVLSNSAGTNITWNTGTNKFDVRIATTAALGVVQVGSGLSITPAGLLSANATSYTLPIATNTILGGVRPDNTSIIVNSLTGLISLSGDNIILSNLANRDYGWGSTTSALGRAAVAGAYSTGSIIGDIVLRSAGNLRLQSGTTNPALVINTSNQALINNSLGVATTSITSGFVLDVSGNVTMRNSLCLGKTSLIASYALDVSGNIITTGNIALANASRSIFWTGTNSNLARAGVAGEYSSSAAINDIVLRSGNKLILQSGTGAAAMVIDTANNVYIGASTNSSDDGNINITTPDSTFYVRGPRTAATTTNISFRGGLEGNSNGKVRIWMSSDAAHSSFIESHHTGNGNTQLTFGTANGNVLPTERMRIANNGNVGIGNTAPTGPLCVGDSRIGGSNGFIVIGKNNGSWGARSQYIGYNPDFDLVIGDYGGGTGPLIEAFKVSYAAPANSLVINGSGNVGIGVTNPDSPLEINGNVSIRDANYLYFGQSTSNVGSWSTRMYANGSTHLFNAQTLLPLTP